VQVKGRGRRAWDASGELVLHPSTEIQAAAAPLVWAIPAHLYLLEVTHQSHNMLHINQREPELCPEAAQTRVPSPALRFQDASSASCSCRSTAGRAEPLGWLNLAPPAPVPLGALPPRALALSLSPLPIHPLLTVLGTCLIFDVSQSFAGCLLL